MRILKERKTLFVLLVFTLIPILAMLLPISVSAQTAERCFAETGFCISGDIRAYWEKNGGLPIFGYPIGPQTVETIEGTWTGPVQWFQRDRIEDHSNEGKGVLTGRLGAERLAQLGRVLEQGPGGGDFADCKVFQETGHVVCGIMLTYWKTHGGLSRLGLPLTPLQQEEINGTVYAVQWFERRRAEIHVEFIGTPDEIMLGLLGNEVLAAQAAK